MTQGEKQLLLKDLSGRLQYGVHCRVFKLNETIKEDDDILYGIIGDNVITLKSNEDECLMYYQVKPYLRAMSSMTDDEKREIYNWLVENDVDWFDFSKLRLDEILISFDSSWLLVDWLNKNHFDYRGLIPKNLAIEVTEENNPYK